MGALLDLLDCRGCSALWRPAAGHSPEGVAHHQEGHIPLRSPLQDLVRLLQGPDGHKRCSGLARIGEWPEGPMPRLSTWRLAPFGTSLSKPSPPPGRASPSPPSRGRQQSPPSRKTPPAMPGGSVRVCVCVCVWAGGGGGGGGSGVVRGPACNRPTPADMATACLARNAGNMSAACPMLPA